MNRMPLVSARVVESFERHNEHRLIRKVGWKQAVYEDELNLRPEYRLHCYRILCGFGWQPNAGSVQCSYRLGIAYSSRSIDGPRGRDNVRHLNMASEPRSPAYFDLEMDQFVFPTEWWWLHNPTGLSQAADGNYKTIRSTSGRRPLRRNFPLSREVDHRGIVGDLVVLPAIVVCRECGRPNTIELPDGATI